MSRLFNAYVMVNWSAAAAAKVGKDAVWIGVLKRDIRFRLTFEAFNPPTRKAGEDKLREVWPTCAAAATGPWSASTSPSASRRRHRAAAARRTRAGRACGPSWPRTWSTSPTTPTTASPSPTR